MPHKAVNNDQKFRIVIYHGHLHKILIDDDPDEISENEVVVTEE